MPRTTVIFDMGGVLIDWNPRHLYRKLFPGDEAAMEEFLAIVCTPAWNLRQDGGRPLAEATRQLIAEHPDKAELIAAYYGRWDEMIPQPIAGMVELVTELRDRGVPIFGLSNTSAETYPRVREKHPFVRWLRGMVTSGEEGVLKPDPAIYRLAVERFAIDPLGAVFIDDNKVNAEAAEVVGIKGIHFTGAEALRAELVGLGLLPG
jgi:2-haloacid dehalogenase